MVGYIDGSMLRDLVQCERRLALDLHGGQGERDEVSDFVRMLWEGGNAHEANIVEQLSGRVADLRNTDAASRVARTRAAIKEDVDWIVGGRLVAGDLLGVPDLLRSEDGQWWAGDVKSGAALDDAGRPRTEYRAQVGHYAAIVDQLGLGSGDRAFVIGRNGSTTWYDMNLPLGKAAITIKAEVSNLVEKARLIRDGAHQARPALSSICSMCHWKTVCRQQLEADDDLTLIAGLGRSLRAVLEPHAATVTGLAKLDMNDRPVGTGKALPGLGVQRLFRFRDRARLLRTPGAAAFARRDLGLRRYDREFHFDIETHPLRDGFVYLHGILDVRGDEESYFAFFAEDEASEEQMFAAAYDFLTSDVDVHIFYYSKFERTSYRALARKYPSVCSESDIEALFDRSRATDLLGDVVQPFTEWPTHSVGIKALAKHLGFRWRDVDPSGAASIAWFDAWLKTADPIHRERIETYNEDDCRATLVLLKALIELPMADGAEWPSS